MDHVAILSTKERVNMRNRQKVMARKVCVSLVITLMTVGAALGQAQREGEAGRNQAAQKEAAAAAKARPDAGDVLAKVPGAAQRNVTSTSHYTFRLRSFDGTPLAASYYPSRLGNSAPVLMLIHEMGRSRK